MKRLFLLAFMLLSVSFSSWAQVKIALLEPRVSSSSAGVTDMEKAMIRGELRKAIVNHGGYEAFTRADIDQLMKEQDFQRTGMVSENDIKRLGEMSGADYICVSTLSKSNAEFYLEAYLINIETGSISNPASQYGELKNGKLANMLDVCKNLAVELINSTSIRNVNKKQSEAVVSSNSMKPMIRNGGCLYEGTEKLNNEQLKKMLSGEEYFLYSSGRSSCRWGNALMISGAPVALGVFVIVSENQSENELEDVFFDYLDPLQCAIGSLVVFEVAGVILKVVGNKKLNKVANRYNQRNSLALRPTTVGFKDDMGRAHLGAGLNLSLNF